MRRVLPFLTIALLAAIPIAGEEDKDDGVMGVWQGLFVNDDWQDMSFSAHIVAQGPIDGAERWRMILLFGDWQNPDAKAEIEGVRAEPEAKTVPFGGEINLGEALGGSYRVAAEFADGVITGKMNGKGRPVEFKLQRMDIKSPTLGQAPPDGAVVLMDGTNLDAWERYPLKWNLLDDGATEVAGSNFKTIEEFGSGQLHVEFRTPFMPKERGQGRGNSGVYVLGRYEVQVLDSFGLDAADNLCGGIYKKAVPRVSACLPPLTWQTYDITFTTAQFDASGQKTANARITVVQNGVVIHDDVKLDSPTPGGVSGEDAASGPMLFQDHGNRVGFRNVWFVPAAG
jgi:hypothetical protein